MTDIRFLLVIFLEPNEIGVVPTVINQVLISPEGAA